MKEKSTPGTDLKEITVLALVPVLVGLLTIVSWSLAHWHIGPYYLNAGIALFAALFGGLQRFISGFKDLFKFKITVNVFVLVALAATLAVGEFRPAAIIVFIMAVAGALESYTLDKTKKSIKALLDFAPETATIRRENIEVTIPISEIRVNDIVIVRPGERIAVDGIVVTGASSVNQAPITGESMPVEKFKGTEVFSGTLNEDGMLEIQTIKTGENTTLSKIVHLVQDAQGTRAPIQNIADRFTVWFLPAVLLLAVIGYCTSGNIHVAVSILLVACPCAFAIATPTAITAGVSNMARRSVLIKGGIFLETANKIDTLLVDKTGTLTFGTPKVKEVIAFEDTSESEVLYMAAIAERYSEHPLARAVIKCCTEQGVEIPEPDEFKVTVGNGVIAAWNNKNIVIGKEDFLLEKGVPVTPDVKQAISNQTGMGRTVIIVSVDYTITGLIAIVDEIRPEISQSIAKLKEHGIKRVIMLTGDNERVASAVAEEIGADDFKAGLLPEEKQDYVKTLQEEGHIVGMIGDGINDAPALALADIGIAMGTAGTDVAIETADVTLMNDDLSRVVDFIWMSGKVLRRIKLNIFFSIIYNVIGLTLGSFGMLTPILAVIFQEAGCITVVLSSTLLLLTKFKHSG